MNAQEMNQNMLCSGPPTMYVVRWGNGMGTCCHSIEHAMLLMKHAMQQGQHATMTAEPWILQQESCQQKDKQA